MPNISVSIATATTFAALLLTSACTNSTNGPPSAGQRISDRGSDISARGLAWSNGQDDQQKGEKLVKKSDKRVADGEDDLRDAQEALAKAEQKIVQAQNDKVRGQAMIASGAEQMQQAESDYLAIRDRPPAVSKP